MPLGLKRYHQEGDDHFITFSCHNRKPYLNTSKSRDIFLDSLERTRTRYNFEILGYVIMPEGGWPMHEKVPIPLAPHSCSLIIRATREPSSANRVGGPYIEKHRYLGCSILRCGPSLRRKTERGFN